MIGVLILFITSGRQWTTIGVRYVLPMILPGMLQFGHWPGE
jgi:hypothetical protein